jgi:uncharacterized protein
MYRQLLAAVASVTLIAAAAQAQELDGVWAGGTNVTGRWQFTQAHLTKAGGTIELASAQAAGLPVEEVVREGSRLRFRIRTPLGVMTFDGSLQGDSLVGALSGGAPGASVHFVRTVPPPARQSDAAVGLYDAGDNQELLLTYRAFGQLTGVVIQRTGDHEAVRRSFFAIPVGPDRYLISGSIVKAIKRDETLALERKGESVVGVRWVAPNGASRVLRRVPGLGSHQVAVRFDSPTGSIPGTLFFPEGQGRHAAVAIVSGSGPTGRDANVLRAREFARIGVVALTWDKRGVGEAPGDYWSAGLDDLANDAARALDFLRSRPELDPTRVGITGHSQGAWIAPMAALAARNAPRWVIITSGGPIHPAEQEAWRARTQTRSAGGSDADGRAAEEFMRRKWQFAFTGEDWAEYFARARAAQAEKWASVVSPILSPDSLGWAFMRSLRSFDPKSAPSRLRMPVLVLFGEHDEDEPADVTRTLWEETFRRSGSTDHAIETIPGATHSLWIGGGNPRRLIATPTAVIGRWLSAHGGVEPRLH